MWRNLKIGHKITVGMFSVTLLLIVVSAAAGWALFSAAGGFQEYRGLARDTNLAGRLQANMLMVRMNVKDFQITGSEKDKKQYTEYMDKMRGFLTTAQSEIQNPERAALIDRVEEDQVKYDQNFQKIIQFRKDRNQVVYEVLNVEGPQIEKKLTEIMTSANQDNDASAAYQAGLSLRHLLLARLYQAKFLDVNSQDNCDRVKAEFEALHAKIQTLDEQLQNEHRRALLADTRARVKKYQAAFLKLDQIIRERNEIQHNILDKIGPQIAKDTEDVKLHVMADQDALGPQLQATNNSALLKIGILSSLAIVFALILTPILVRGITKPLKRMVTLMQKVGAGDMSEKIEVKSKDEIGQSMSAMNVLIDNLRDLLNEVTCASREVASAATEIAATNEEISRGVDEQSSQTRQISSAIEQMAATTVEVSNKATSASGSANDAGQQAQNGGEVVSETVTGMTEIASVVSNSAQSVTELGKQSEEIGQIIAVINDIADQTNLLALNAAIEAARAGDHGRGFAVVADEVRQLAERTSKATQEVSESIKSIQAGTQTAVKEMQSGADSVKYGVELANRAGESLEIIMAGSQDVASMIDAIAAATEEQSAAAEEISHNIESIAAISSQTASSVQQSAAASQQLSDKAEALMGMVAKFKLA